MANLRGRIVIVDAPNTAYALQVKKILLNAGLKAGDYTVKPVGGGLVRAKAMQENRDNAASILNPPFSFSAVKDGMKSMGRTIDLLGPYQGMGAFVMLGLGKPMRWSATSRPTSRLRAGRAILRTAPSACNCSPIG